MRAKKSKKKRLIGYFEELEEFNRVITQRAVRKSGKEYVRIFYGNARSLNKQKEEILRTLAIEEDADVIAISEAGILQGDRSNWKGSTLLQIKNRTMHVTIGMGK